MKEDFLHYIWQHQYFEKNNLCTQEGEPLIVLKPGLHNTDAGPDFLNARLQIGEVEWNGAVEIHLRASDWQRHQHQHDPKYDQVILHVVLEADQPVQRTNGTLVPALALTGRIAAVMVRTYHNLLENPQTLPCAPFLAQIPSLTSTMMVGRALLERVEQKAEAIAALHQLVGADWEAAAYHTLATAFGFKKNNEPMAALAKLLPVSILRKHRHDLRQLEALLFGQAGFLTETSESVEDDYLTALRSDYAFLHHKYRLAPPLHLHSWNFLRLRPANFPPVRIAQLAAVLHARPSLFDALLTALDTKALEQFFMVPVSSYWRRHYRPGKSAGNVPALGRSSVYLLITNAVVPLRVAYAQYLGQPELVESALSLLEQLPAEANHITDSYAALGFEHRTAADSQGLLALERGYCTPRRCLKCAIGNRILQYNPVMC